MQKTVVILGSGFAGISFLLEIKKLLGKEVNVIVIDPRKNVVNRPTMPEVAFEHKPVESALFPIRKVIERNGAVFIEKRAELIKPTENRVVLEDGQEFSYDYLFIATCGVKDYASVEGFYQYGYSLCDEEQAARLAAAVDNFDGGPVVIGAAYTQFGSRLQDVADLAAPCEGPIGEAMLMLQHIIKERGLEKESPITVFSPGKIFFEDVGPKVHEEFEPIIKAANINVIANKRVKKIGSDFVEFEDGEQIPSKFTIIIPPYKAHRVCINSNIGDERGFIPVDETMKHLDYDNIYAAGDASARTQPKLGHLAVIGGNVAASAIANAINPKHKVLEYKPEVLCIMNRGGGEATMIWSNHLYGGDKDIAFSGRIPHFMKWGFDFYYGFTNGHMPPEFLEGLVKLFLKK